MNVKKTSTELKNFILEDKLKNRKVLMTFTCTSNSIGSHISQVWMQTAAICYGIDSLKTFSGSTEANEVNKRAFAALNRARFTITRTSAEFYSPYLLIPFCGAANWLLYLKKYDNFQDQKSNFIAVIVCSEANKSCLMVPGANGRIELPYQDPKYYDNTPSEQRKDDETCRLLLVNYFLLLIM